MGYPIDLAPALISILPDEIKENIFFIFLAQRRGLKSNGTKSYFNIINTVKGHASWPLIIVIPPFAFPTFQWCHIEAYPKLTSSRATNLKQDNFRYFGPLAIPQSSNNLRGC